MLLEFMGVLSKNKTGLIKDFRINIESERRIMRMKFIVINKGREEDLDISLMYTIPQLSINQYSMDFYGNENIRGIKFSVSATYGIFSNRYMLKGKIGNDEFDLKGSDIETFVAFTKELINSKGESK